MLRTNNIPFLTFLMIFVAAGNFSYTYAQNQALPQAHAHNDYRHMRPLLDALAQGFCSIEVDVFPVGDQLLVYHDPQTQWDTARSLTRMYLLPLSEIARENQGRIYPGYQAPIYLMIDVKREGEKAYHLIREKLRQHPSLIMHLTEGAWTEGPVRVFISGERATERILQDPENWMGLDGRPQDLGNGIDAMRMPVVSQSFRQYSSWNGIGKMPRKDYKAIRSLAKAVHKEGKRLRLWATPENETTWETLQKAGVDLLNTDDLERLRTYLQ